MQRRGGAGDCAAVSQAMSAEGGKRTCGITVAERLDEQL